MLADDVRRALRVYPDFPTKGVVFQDIAPLLRDPALFARVVDAMAAPFAGRVTKVAAIESRGFVLGVPVAQRLGVGFVPVRKVGKLPGATLAEKYDLEYGTAAIEVQRDAISPGEHVLIVDDVLATGGTARAAASLVVSAGGRVAGFSFLLAIGALRGSATLGTEPHVILSV